MQIIDNTRGQRTHEIRILELRTGQNKSFSIKTKDSLQTIFAKIIKELKK